MKKILILIVRRFSLNSCHFKIWHIIFSCFVFAEKSSGDGNHATDFSDGVISGTSTKWRCSQSGPHTIHYIYEYGHSKSWTRRRTLCLDDKWQRYLKDYIYGHFCLFHLIALCKQTKEKKEILYGLKRWIEMSKWNSLLMKNE